VYNDTLLAINKQHYTCKYRNYHDCK